MCIIYSILLLVEGQVNNIRSVSFLAPRCRISVFSLRHYVAAFALAISLLFAILLSFLPLLPPSSIFCFLFTLFTWRTLVYHKHLTSSRLTTSGFKVQASSLNSVIPQPALPPPPPSTFDIVRWFRVRVQTVLRPLSSFQLVFSHNPCSVMATLRVVRGLLRCSA